MGHLAFAFACGLVLFLADAVLPNLAVQTSRAELPLLVDVGDPHEDPQAVQDRVETGSPEETVLHDRTRFIFGVFVVALAVAMLAALVWAFRAGRQNRPASRGRKEPD